MATQILYKPNEHADEYIIFLEDEAEVSASFSLINPSSVATLDDTYHLTPYVASARY